MILPETKVCRRCFMLGEPASTYFSLDRSSSDGLQTYCKACNKESRIDKHRKIAYYTTNHSLRRSTFSPTIREKWDRIERQGGEVWVEVDGGVYRWGVWKQATYTSMAQWMQAMTERGWRIEIVE
jgi:hypothetical protein